MADRVVHLFAGEQNQDGTATVTSAITLCCAQFAPLGGHGTVNAAVATCPGLKTPISETDSS